VVGLGNPNQGNRALRIGGTSSGEVEMMIGGDGSPIEDAIRGCFACAGACFSEFVVGRASF
jgi:hypothetical protein